MNESRAHVLTSTENMSFSNERAPSTSTLDNLEGLEQPFAPDPPPDVTAATQRFPVNIETHSFLDDAVEVPRLSYQESFLQHSPLSALVPHSDLAALPDSIFESRSRLSQSTFHTPVASSNDVVETRSDSARVERSAPELFPLSNLSSLHALVDTPVSLFGEDHELEHQRHSPSSYLLAQQDSLAAVQPISPMIALRTSPDHTELGMNASLESPQNFETRDVSPSRASTDTHSALFRDQGEISSASSHTQIQALPCPPQFAWYRPRTRSPERGTFENHNRHGLALSSLSSHVLLCDFQYHDIHQYLDFHASDSMPGGSSICEQDNPSASVSSDHMHFGSSLSAEKSSSIPPPDLVILHTTFGPTIWDEPLSTSDVNEAQTGEIPYDSPGVSIQSDEQLTGAVLSNAELLMPHLHSRNLGFRALLDRMMSTWSSAETPKQRWRKIRSKFSRANTPLIRASPLSNHEEATSECVNHCPELPPTSVDWLAFGRFARPYLDDNDVTVINNHPPPPRNVCDAHERHLTSHSSIPPRPPHWPEPTNTIPTINHPTTTYIVNPRLRAPVSGRQHLLWDIRFRPTALYFNVDSPGAMVIPPSAYGEPVTWPLCKELRVTKLAGDAHDPWPWPFSVRNPAGVVLEDLVKAVYHSFSQAIWPHEWASWPQERRETVERTWAARLADHELACLENAKKGIPPPPADLGNEILRVDYLLGYSYFRGIQPSADGDGWVLHFGAL